MKILYKDIIEDSVAVDYATSFIEEEGRYDNLTFSGILSKIEDIYALTGDLKFLFNTCCDRCLVELNLNINESVYQLISPTEDYMAQQSEAGLSDDEADIYVTSSEYFDVDEYLHEEAILITPFKRLCKADCKGICDVCGANLNIEECNCKSEAVDVRWKKLINLDKGK